jgi:hypothetical protein
MKNKAKRPPSPPTQLHTLGTLPTPAQLHQQTLSLWTKPKEQVQIVPDLSIPPPTCANLQTPPPVFIKVKPCPLKSSKADPPNPKLPTNAPDWLIALNRPHFFYSRAFIQYAKKFSDKDFDHLWITALRAAKAVLLNKIDPQLLYQFQFLLFVWQKLVQKLSLQKSKTVQQQIHLGLLTNSAYTHHLAQFTIEHIQKCPPCAIEAINRIIKRSYDFVTQSMHQHDLVISDISANISKSGQPPILQTDYWRLIPPPNYEPPTNSGTN